MVRVVYERVYKLLFKRIFCNFLTNVFSVGVKFCILATKEAIGYLLLSYQYI